MARFEVLDAYLKITADHSVLDSSLQITLTVSFDDCGKVIGLRYGCFTEALFQNFQQSIKDDVLMDGTL